MNRSQLSRILMIAAIGLIAVFQSYWLNRLYKEEWQGLQKETNGIFRDLVYNLQVERFKADTLIFRDKPGNNLFYLNAVNAIRRKTAGFRKDSIRLTKDSNSLSASTVVVVNTTHAPTGSPFIKIKGDSFQVTRKIGNYKLPDSALLNRMHKEGINMVVRYGAAGQDSEMPPVSIIGRLKKISPDQLQRVTITHDNPPQRTSDKVESMRAEKSFIRMISNGKSLDDSLPVARLDSVYKKELTGTGILIGFTIRMGKDDSLHQKDTAGKASLRTDLAKVGIIHPYWYRAEFENPAGYLLKKILPQILFSIFLVVFTTVTFIFLYRNLVAQRKLTQIKNDFISNITHELKTPIATVSVAVEALRNFGGMEKPERTREYLDISASELQRLSLLVDKVLKLSLFESKELEMRTEQLDLKQLTEEVLNTMKLQFDKQHAKVDLLVQGQYFTIDADRLHITSVIYNLLDNALKYSTGHPQITVRLIHHINEIELQVTDKGIGIESGFTQKIFEKFFRVPTGNQHNIKGYGLGLSYVSHVVKRHKGTISVDTAIGRGSTFIIKFPIA